MGTTYVVEVDFQTKGELVAPAAAKGLKELQVSAGDVKEGFLQASAVVTDFASGAAKAFTGVVETMGKVAFAGAAIAVGGAMAAIHHGVIGVNAELETTQSSMAAIFNAQGMTTGGMVGAMTVAGEQIGKMRQDAKALPGEFMDLANIMRTIMPSAAGMGMKVDDVRKMSGLLMASGAAVGMQMDQVAREAAQLLDGKAGGHNVLGMRLMGLSGDKAQKFNKLSDEDRVKKLNDELGKYGPAIDAISKTFGVVSSTLKDNVSMFAGDATKGLFERIKADLSHVNDWFEKNQDKVSIWADMIGRRLVSMYDNGREQLMKWGPILLDFADRAERKLENLVTKLGPLFEKISTAAEKFLTDDASFAKMESILKLYAAVKIGGSEEVAGTIGHVASLGGGIAKMVPGLMGGGQMVGAAGFGGELAGGAGGAAAAGGLAASATIAVPVFIALALAVGEVAAAVQVFADNSEEREKVMTSLAGVSQAFSDFVESPAVKGLKDAFDEIVTMVGTNVLDDLVTGLNELALAIKAVNKVLDSAHSVKTGVGAYMTDMAYGEGTDDAIRRHKQDDPETYRKWDKDMMPAIGMVAMAAGDIVRANADEKKKAGKAPKSSTNIQKVEIVVNQNSDPARLARLVTAEIQNLARHPKVARNAPNFAR